MHKCAHIKDKIQQNAWKLSTEKGKSTARKDKIFLTRPREADRRS